MYSSNNSFFTSFFGPHAHYRHSGNFYKIFSTPVEMPRIHPHSHLNPALYGGAQTQTVLSVLSAYCADADPSTRKFASFAGKLLLLLSQVATGMTNMSNFVLFLT